MRQFPSDNLPCMISGEYAAGSLTVKVEFGADCIRRLSREVSDGGLGALHRLRPLFVTERDAFGVDEANVRDAEEAEHGLEVAVLVLEGGVGCARAVEAAAGGGDDHRLAPGQPLGTLLCVAEG